MGEDPMVRAAVHAQVRGCRACNLCDVGRGPVSFRGGRDSKIVVVGEAPGREEDEAGKPFVGPSGRLVGAAIRQAGFDPDMDVAYLNVVSCYPNRTPTDAERDACQPNLLSQLEYLAGDRMLVLGGVALSAWWSGVRMGEVRGRRFTVGKVTAVCTWHPAAVLRNRSLYGQFCDDVSKAVSPIDYFDDSLYTCVKCGGLSDVWVTHDGRVVTDEGGAQGLPFCQKHYDTRVGKAGRGKVVPTRAKRKVTTVEERLFK